MSDLLAHHPRSVAVSVVRRLHEAGHVAYLAGGCVRDELLGLVPKDYDIATDATPDVVRSLFRRTQAVGAAFGVILVREQGQQIEVATFRTDLDYRDGRRPEGVRFSNAEEDAQRRDFTINGLFMDPLEEDRVIDFVGGREDLENRILRAIGEPGRRFAEDHLRMLRAVRFAARFDLAVDHGTAEAITRNAEKLQLISEERIGDELRRILPPPSRLRAWPMLWRLRLWPVVMREVDLPRPVPLNEQARPHFDAGASCLLRLPTDRNVSVGLSLAAGLLDWVAHAVGWHDPRHLFDPGTLKRHVSAVRDTLKLSNDESAEMLGAMDIYELLLGDEPGVAQIKRFLARPSSDDARLLLDALPQDRIPPRLVERVAWLRGRFTELEREKVAPPPLVTGDDLQAAGLTPGPMFKRVLDAVYDAQLENRVADREAALAMALDLARA